MKISGFTFMRNTSKLFYPFIESINSILPLVDEFIIAMGDNDIDDTTLSEVLSLNSPKIKIIESPWNTKLYPANSEYARQTDVAMKACSGDWLFYLQSDEVIHEEDHQEILMNCNLHLKNQQVEGFLFNYHHFWGDYKHVQKSHGFYWNEIRIIRNKPEIHSWKDAQSFRKIPNFSGVYSDYFIKKNTEKLNVIKLKAKVYHYGHVRPPDIMYRKYMMMKKTSRGENPSDYSGIDKSKKIDYGPMDKVPLFTGTHPKVMELKIKKMDWDHLLQKTGPIDKTRPINKHEKFRYKLTTFFEKLLGREIGGFNNYKIIKKI